MSEQQQTQQDIDAREALLQEIGRRLREARREQGRSIADVAQALRLRKPYLEALEAGDWRELPGEAYAIGFLKQYAALLGLDLSDELDTIRSGDYQLTKPLTFPDPPIAPARRWAYIATGLFVLLFIMFNVVQLNHDATPEHPPVVPATSQPEYGDETAPLEAAQQSDQQSSATQAPAQEPAAQPMPAAEPAAVVEPSQPTDSAPTSPAANQPLARAPAAAEKHTFEFRAVDGDVWLEVYGPAAEDGGKPVRHIYRLLKQGETRSFTSTDKQLRINAGNPGALQIAIDGRVVVSAGELGRHHKVVRGYPLRVPQP